MKLISAFSESVPTDEKPGGAIKIIKEIMFSLFYYTTKYF